MSVVLRFALGVAGAWPRLYTLGLSPAMRQSRLDLIRADLQDQVDDDAREGISPKSTAASMLGRCLCGAPSDLTWRLFDVGGAPSSTDLSVDFSIDGGPKVYPNSPGVLYFSAASVVAWAGVLFLLFLPVAYSLAFVGTWVALLALMGWVLEAPATESDRVAPSVWPLLLSVGIAASMAGLIFGDERLGLLLLAPVALGFGAVAARQVLPQKLSGLSADGRKPVAAAVLRQRSGSGDVIAIETWPARGVSRRALLRGSLGIGLASAFAAMGGIVVDFLWQRNVAGFGGVVTAGHVADFPPGSKTIVRAGKFWLVNLTEEQGGPGFLALWQKCPHLGCVVPWLDTFRFHDPDRGVETEGWFRCPGHQSTYNDAGVRVFGPAPRSMDHMALQVTPEGYIEVDTGVVSKGAEDKRQPRRQPVGETTGPLFAAHFCGHSDQSPVDAPLSCLYPCPRSVSSARGGGPSHRVHAARVER